MPTGRSSGRRVVLICGAPGAGKTTEAQRLAGAEGLTVYDLDDPQWSSERQFNRALEKVGRDSRAHAVVIRSGATLSSRERAAVRVRATEVKVLAVDAETCIRRVTERKRSHPPMRTQIAAVKSWWRRYQPGPVFLETGPAVTPRPVNFSLPESQDRRGRGRAKTKTSDRGYGNAHQKLRKELAPKVEAGNVRCWRCGDPIRPSEAWDLGHDDRDRSRYRGPEHASCNRATAGRQVRRWNSREW